MSISTVIVIVSPVKLDSPPPTHPSGAILHWFSLKGEHF